ncbi:MAG: hypothetical protein OEW09_00035 [Anaerolineae bacterium]|nr:hypothetical protein [Anaerolineae bacterium]
MIRAKLDTDHFVACYRYLRFNLILGAAAGLLILGTFAASALWYFVH